MTDYLKVNLANWNDRAAIHVKDAAGGYRVKEFLSGEDNLHGIEDREIGDVRGKRIAQLSLVRIRAHGSRGTPTISTSPIRAPAISRQARTA